MQNDPNIKVDIDADINGYENKLDQAGKKLDEFKRKAGDTKDLENNAVAATRAADAIKLVGGAAGIVTTTIVAGTAAWVAYQGVQVAAALQIAKTADEMGKMSQRLGIGIEALSELRYSFALNGQSAGEMDAILARLSGRMQDVARGNSTAALAFKAIGVEVTTSNGSLKSQAQVLGEVADRIAGYRDGAAKTALVVDLLGRGSEKLIPLLNQGAQGFADNAEEARKLGAIYSDSAAKAAAEFNDNLTKLRFAAEGVKISLGGEMLAVLARFSTEMIEGTKAAGGFWSALWMGATLNPFKDTGENLKSVRADLAQMESDLKEYGYLDEQRYQRKKAQLEYLKALQRDEALKLGAGVYSNEGRQGVAPEAPALGEKDKKSSLGRDLEPARLKAEYAERYKLIKEGTELEQQLLKTAQAQGLISEEVFQAQMYEAIQAGMVKRAGALSAQLQATENPVDRERILGDIRLLGTESAKAAAQYQEAIAKIDAARRKSMSDTLAGEGRRVASIEEHNKALQEELETVGLSTEQLAAYTRAKSDAAAAAEYLTAKNLEEAAATMEGNPALAEARDYYLALAAAKREAGKSLQENGQLQAAVIASKASAAEWKHGWEETDRLARDVFTSWGTEGGNAAKKIGKSLEKALLGAIYEAQLKPIAFQLYSSATNALGMSNGTSSLGAVGNIASAGNSLFNGGIGAGYGAFASSSVGQAFGLSTAMGAGYSAPVYGPGGALISAGSEGISAGGLTGFGQALGTAMPWVAAAIAVYTLVSSLMGKGGGPKTGGDSFLSFSGDSASAMSSSQLAALMPNLGGNTPGVGYFTPDNGNATVSSAISPAGASVAETIRKLGGSVDGLKLGLGYDTDPQGTASSRVQSGVYRADGTAVYDSMRDVGRDADMAKEMTVELQRMTLGAIKAASGIPKIFKDVVDGIDLATASAEQMTAAMTQIGNTQTLVDYTKLDPFEAWTTAQETAAEGVMGAWQKQHDAAAKLIESFDGSAASTANLAASVTALAQTEAQVVAYLNQSLAALRANTQQDAESMYLSTLDNQGQYQYRMAMSSRLEGQMATASTPEEVMALNGQLRGNYQAAWGLLSPEQQRQYGAQYFGTLDQSTGQFSGGYLGDLQGRTESSLAPFGDAVSASHDLLSSDSLVSQLSDVLGILPDKMQAVADRFNAAMDRMESAVATLAVAAETPVKVESTVVVTGPAYYEQSEA